MMSSLVHSRPVTPPAAPKRGRPPTANPRTMAIPLRVSAAEHAAIVKAAKANRTTVSGFIRAAALAAAR